MNTACCNSDVANSVSVDQSCAQEKINDASIDGGQNRVFRSIAKHFTALKDYVVLKYNQHIDRQAFNHLLKLDDNILKDIGITRGDVTWASQLPETEDAAAEIEKIARGR